MNRIRIIAAAGLAALGLVAAAPASASPSEKEDVMTVRIGDLNVESQAGAESALRRIKAASTKFCGEQSRDLDRHFATQRCIRKMTGKAVAQLNAPMVNALYTGQPNIQLAKAEPQR